MKKFALLKCFPAGLFRSGNVCIAECEAKNLTEAITQLQHQCPYTLNTNGYVKVNNNSFVVCESMSFGNY